MSPANIDDASGSRAGGSGRPLTRKELRAREKSLETGKHGAVPEQAYETGHDIPPQPVQPPVALPQEEPAVPPAPVEPPAAQEPAAATVPPAPVTPPGINVRQDLRIEAHHGAEQQPDAPLVDEPHYAGQHYAEEPGHGHGYDDGLHQDAVLLREDFHHPELHEDQHHDDDLHHGLLPAAVAAPPRPSKKVRRRRRILALFLTLAVFITAVAVGAQFLKPLLGDSRPSDFPGPGTGEVQVTVANGEGSRSVAATLENEQVIANADTFLQAFNASGGTLSPGDYTFKREMKNSDAVSVLLGEGSEKVIYFALSAGLRIGESLQAISEGSGISIQDLQSFSDKPAQFGLPPAAKNLEGYLAPGEYRFPLGTSAKDILQKLVDTTVDELVAQGITDPAKQYQAVTVASIVQAEGGQADYGNVAGAIYNRLKPNDQTNGYLQVDSAVTYGLGTRSFNFTEEQRRDKSNPYNTYANPGLPPGPIGSPGRTAIDAAAKPTKNDFLYWVTINLDTGETKFAKTLAEHNAYVEQYNNWCRANEGRCT
ncbi:endolytic transglycosylase MltG [Pseudarthrobacter sp. NPDC058362]|uniref:endolytic transglycosylase MltG n=1 Tax=unclassified Pseudarthrobacter TaxID=2647000 RepID=UPI00365987D8